MFVWAPIPEQFKEMGSLEFSKKLLIEAKVAVSPGIGFGSYGDQFVRFALIENEHRTRQAIRSIRAMLREENPQSVVSLTGEIYAGMVVENFNTISHRAHRVKQQYFLCVLSDFLTNKL